MFTCCSKDPKTSNKISDEDKRDLLDFQAPSVYYLQTKFLKEMEEAGHDKYSKIYDIESLRADPGVIRTKGLEVTCPIDGKRGAAYVHCIDENPDHVGQATHMLSYTWGYMVCDIVDTLVQFCEDKGLDIKRTYIWICCLCNNQHRVVEKDVPFEEFQFIFNKRVRGVGNILAMMTPWSDPGYLKRIWCIFEMYSANADKNCNIQIIMPPAQKHSLVEAVLKPTDQDGRNGLDDLFGALANTKVENASATQPNDKVNILKLVDESPGYDELNKQINVLIRAWIQDTVMDAVKDREAMVGDDEQSRRDSATFLTFCASYFSRIGAHREALKLHTKGLEMYQSLEIEEAEELAARCYNNIGTEFETLGEYEKALESHQKCREAFEKIYGEEHENTSVSYFNIGAVFRKLERNEEALEMYTKSLEIDKKIKGDNHIDVALSYSYIGRLKQHGEDYEGALDLFQKSLTIRENTYGTKHPDAAVGYGDMGLLYHAKGDYNEAIVMHKKAVAINESILGQLHPDSASVYQNLGGAYYEQGDFDKSLELHLKAKAAYESSLGADHPKTKVSDEWIQIVKDAMYSQG